MSTVCDPFIEAAGDIDGDGEVSAIDVTWLQRYLVNVDTPYPINEMVQPTV